MEAVTFSRVGLLCQLPSEGTVSPVQKLVALGSDMISLADLRKQR